jgi:hypothetical protein
MKIETYDVSKELVISVPTPDDTRTYKSMSHERLIDLTLEGIQRSGFVLDGENYTMARGGNVANGKYSIRNIADDEMQIQIGWQNSLDKSISLKWAMGVRIFICSNGCISGDMGAFKKKHQGEVQSYTPQAISEYIKTAGDVFLNMQKERDTMKQIEVTKRVTAELLGRIYFEEGFIQSTQLNIIKSELSHPTHDYNAPNSLWELYNFVSFSMKSIHPSNWISDHIDAHSFFTSQTGIIIPQKELVLSPVEDKRQLSLYDEYELLETQPLIG